MNFYINASDVATAGGSLVSLRDIVAGQSSNETLKVKLKGLVLECNRSYLEASYTLLTLVLFFSSFPLISFSFSSPQFPFFSQNFNLIETIQLHFKRFNRVKCKQLFKYYKMVSQTN